MSKVQTKMDELQLGLDEIIKSFSVEPEYVKNIPTWLKHISDCLSDIREEMSNEAKEA